MRDEGCLVSYTCGDIERGFKFDFFYINHLQINFLKREIIIV